MTGNKSVPMLDPIRGNKNMQNELDEAALRVLHSGKYILGDEVASFEKSCSDLLGVRHAIGVSSGTDALLLALMALDIGRGDEVIVPSFTFFATAGCVARVGATPVFADIRPDCFTIDPEDVARKITRRTKAIIPVHLFGQCAAMGQFHPGSIYIIEDAAQAIGSEYRTDNAGAMGHVGCFSFFPSKNIGGFGDAGLVTTWNTDLDTKIRCLRNHGQSVSQYKHEYVGGNFRIDALQAALLNVKLKHLGEAQKSRREHAEFYYKHLQDLEDAEYLTMPVEARTGHVFNQFTLRIHDERRDNFVAYLRDHNIGCAIYYPIPLHLQPCFRAGNTSVTSLPETEKASKECVSIPIASELDESELEAVSECIHSFFSTRN